MFSFDWLKNLVIALFAGGMFAPLAFIWFRPAKTDPGPPPGITVELRGAATGVTRVIDGTSMDCFEMDLVEPDTSKVIGTGTECLDLDSIAGNPDEGGFAISNTTILDLPGGTIKSRNRTTMQPLLDGSPEMTHLAGNAPEAENVLSGTGRFASLRGTVHLSGTADLSRFSSENMLSLRHIIVIAQEQGD